MDAKDRRIRELEEEMLYTADRLADTAAIMQVIVDLNPLPPTARSSLIAHIGSVAGKAKRLRDRVERKIP